MRILIVEDERALCDAIARSLRNLAYSVDCCHDGQEALDLLGVEVFDLVVLDLNLPHIDGMTVLRELRKTDCETKVLILPRVAKYPIKSTDSMPVPTITLPSRFIWTNLRQGSAALPSGASHKAT